MGQLPINTPLHEHSLLAVARRELEETTTKLEAAGELLIDLKAERQDAQQCLVVLEIEPVNLKQPNLQKELSISALRRGVAQLDQRIKAAQAEHDRQKRIKERMAGEVHMLEARLGKAERMPRFWLTCIVRKFNS